MKKPTKATTQTEDYGLFSALNRLPDAQRFPTNQNHPRSLALLRPEFEQSSDFLAVTGFSSLEFLVDFFGHTRFQPQQKVRLVLGNEPIFRQVNPKKHPAPTPLAREIEDFWLSEGIAPQLCGAVVQVIELLKNEQIEARISEGLHAKIYVGTTAAMLGSSNFSRSGLEFQKEANVRFEAAEHPADFEAVRQIGNFYFENGQPYNEQLIELLKKLLQFVTWREALARAIAEIIEGDWLRQYPQLAELFQNLQPPLWPTQIEAIGQTLYILDQQGNALVADPTGSGKTRLGAAMLACIKNRIWQRGGAVFDDNSLLICPPQVMDNWQGEFLSLRSEFNNITSQGGLSSGGEETTEILREKLQNARILFIDEAHNYLSKTSKRSEQLQFNTAEHTVLFTATPINRRVEDLFRVIELLDVDNLSDEAILEFDRLRRRRAGRTIKKEEENRLRQYLSQFIVRRTKRELNRKIAAAPDAYRNKFGDTCHYPRQNTTTYPLDEPAADIEIAKKINLLAAELLGVIRLRKIFLKKEELDDPEMRHRTLQMRLSAARALAVYHIQAMLRSSGAALVEHIEGTEAAKIFLQNEKKITIPNIKPDQETGNVLAAITGFKTLPESNLPADELPSFLKNEDEYRAVCNREHEIYQKISQLARQLSLHREQRKANFLADLLDGKHRLVLSFDSKIISLYLIGELLRARRQPPKVLVVTGQRPKNQRGKPSFSEKKEANDWEKGDPRKVAKRIFALGSEEKNWVALCSDVMAEGVNLQAAGAVVLLDVPSVMRIAEQRVGRIDRMNSPFREVDIYFPDDHEEFSLRTDRKFFLTARAVDSIIGGNLDLPEDLLEKWSVERISGREIARQFDEQREQAEQTFADGIQDAFQPVRDLLFGNAPLLPLEIYEQMKTSQAVVVAKVRISLVQSEQAWGFFCLRGSSLSAPQWLYLDEKTMVDSVAKNQVWRDLPQICERLRQNLSAAADLPADAMTEKTSRLLADFFQKIREHELDCLPNKKRRALQLLQEIVAHELAKNKADEPRRAALEGLQKLLLPSREQNFTADLAALAGRWIAHIQPQLVRLRREQPRKTITLKNLKKTLHTQPPATAFFSKLLDSALPVPPVEKRVVACILGLSG